MQLTIEVPDAIFSQIAIAGKDPARAALEGIAIEGYSSRRLGGEDVRRMLGFETSLDVHAFLADHNVNLNYGIQEWIEDESTAGSQSGGLQGIDRFFEMTVVSDTGPINYLVIIGVIEVLEPLYSHVIIPAGVQRELLHVRTPMEVREWIENPPDWLEIREVAATMDTELLAAGLGEREAIAIGEQ